MIYIETNNKEEVIYKHYAPFDEISGLQKSIEELKKTGHLVDSIPSSENREGYHSVMKFRNGAIFYDYIKTKDFSIYGEENEIRIKNMILTKAEIFEELSQKEHPLEDLKQYKKEALSEKCTESIYKGFYSDSLKKTFGFNELDQINFTQQLLIIVASGGSYDQPIQWKSLDGSINDLTVQEFQVLVGEATAHKVKQQQKYWELEKQVLAATTKEEVIAVEW